LTQIKQRLGAPQVPDLSYGLYLYAFPIQQTLIGAGLVSPLPLLAATAPLAILLAGSHGALSKSLPWDSKSALNSARNSRCIASAGQP
jgi:hypothetical protein